jgi:hypothetical protein
MLSCKILTPALIKFEYDGAVFNELVYLDYINGEIIFPSGFTNLVDQAFFIENFSKILFSKRKLNFPSFPNGGGN